MTATPDPDDRQQAIADLRAALRELTGRDIAVEAATETDTPSARPHLRSRALTPLRGAFQLLADRETLFCVDDLQRIVIGAIDDPSQRQLLREGDTLRLRLCLSRASGTFSAQEIFEALRRGAGGRAIDPGWADYRGARLAAVQASFRLALGPAMRLEVEWQGLPHSAEAERRTDFLLAGLLQALRFQAGHPDWYRIMCQELRSIRVSHVTAEADKRCSLVDGTLDYAVDLDTGDAGSFTPDEIRAAVDEALELARRTAKWWFRYEAIPRLERRFLEVGGQTVAVQVDWAELDTEKSRGEQLTRQLQAISHWLSTNLDEPLRHRLGERLAAWRIEWVEDPVDRELSGENGVIVCRICGTGGRQGRFLVDELVDALPGVLAAMPPVDPAAAARQPREPDAEELSEAAQVLEFYRSHVLPVHTAKLRHALRSDIPVEIDWESFAGRPHGARRLRTKGLPAVVDALQQLAPNPTPVPGVDESSVLDLPLERLGHDEADPRVITMLRDGIERVVLRCADSEADASCSIDQGTLCYARPWHTGCSDLTRHDVVKAIRDALAVGVATAAEEVRSGALAEFVTKLEQDLGRAPEVDIDWASFGTHPNPDWNTQAIRDLESRCLRSLGYAFGQLGENARELAASRMKRIRIEHVPSIDAAELVVCGDALLCRLYLYPYPTCHQYVQDKGWETLILRVKGVPDDFDGGLRVDDAREVLPGLLLSLLCIDRCESLRRFETAEADLAEFEGDGFAAVEELAARASRAEPALVVHWQTLHEAGVGPLELCTRALYPLLGALRLLAPSGCFDPQAPGAPQRIEIRHVGALDARSCRLEHGTLHLDLALDRGWAGWFTSHQIATVVRDMLRLDALPIIAELQRETLAWIQRRLTARLDVPVEIEVAWDSILDHPDPNPRLRALRNMRDFSFHRLYYALDGECEADPEFCRLAGERIARLRFENVADPAAIDLLSAGSTLVSRVALFDDYDALTIDDLRERLPEIVAQMPRAPERTPVSEVRAMAALDRFRTERMPVFLEMLPEDLQRVLTVEVDWEGLPRMEGTDHRLHNWMLEPLRRALGSYDVIPMVAARVRTLYLHQAEEASLTLTGQRLEFGWDLRPVGEALDDDEFEVRLLALLRAKNG